VTPRLRFSMEAALSHESREESEERNKSSRVPMTARGRESSSEDMVRLPTRARALSQPPPREDPAKKSSVCSKIVVIAPGAGMHQNGSVYLELGNEPSFQVHKIGHSQAKYDKYPPEWPGGSNPPNLVSFAQDFLQHGSLDKADCLILGSRGGQVILPHLWERRGSLLPPTVVINGGCALKLPKPVQWPAEAVTFLLLGGKDHFCKGKQIETHMGEIQSKVPKTNSTTAILYVNEMPHMPQGNLLGLVLPRMVRCNLAWRSSPTTPPAALFADLAEACGQLGYSGQLAFTVGPGLWLPCLEFKRARSKSSWL